MVRSRFHMERRGRRTVGSIALLLLIGSLVFGTAVAAADDDRVSSPRQYYMALGDSEAFGFQLGKFQQEIATNTYNPASFNTGYADEFAELLRGIRPHIQTVNFSCAGETSATFINGNCPFHNASRPLALHNNYPIGTSQLDAAVDFLKSHRDKVSPITLDIGANDVQNLFFNVCNQDATCTQQGLPAVLAQVGANLTEILTALHAASPKSEIILLTIDNPYVVSIPASTAIVQALNVTLTGVANAHGARVADGYTPISTPTEVCALTLVCIAPLHDIHPNDAGYKVLAQALWAASGYDHLDRDDRSDD